MEGAPDFSAAPHKWSKIKRVVGIVSGKGGVGKSLVTSLMACAMKELGNRAIKPPAAISSFPIAILFQLFLAFLPPAML